MKEELLELHNLLKTIKACSQPCDGHTDPKSMDDCWNWAWERIEKLTAHADKIDLLLPTVNKMHNAQAERIVYYRNEFTENAIAHELGVERGINSVIGIIDQHIPKQKKQLHNKNLKKH